MNPPHTTQPENSNFFVALLASALALFFFFALALGVYEVVKKGPSDGFGFELMLFYWQVWLVGWLALAAVYSTSARARAITRISIALAIALMLLLGLFRYLSS